MPVPVSCTSKITTGRVCPPSGACAARARNVTVPARQYSVNGERRSFALLRPAQDTSSQDRLRDLILDAYKEHEAELAAAV